MLDKFAIAAALRQIGTLLELKGENPFKVRAYENGARALEGIAEDLGRMVDEQRLTSVRGIGAALAAKIGELYHTGRSALLEQLCAELPPGIIELSQIPHLSIKKVQALHDALGIESIAALQAACENGHVSAVKGFGEKTQKKILAGIKEYENRDESILLLDARQLAFRMVDHFKSLPTVSHVEIAGSIRRWQETVRNLNLVVVSDSPEVVFDALRTDHLVTKIEDSSQSRAAVRLANGLRLCVRVCSANDFAVALLIETGSASHIDELNKVAGQKHLVLTESGLFKGKERVNCVDEAEIYQRVGVNFIPPELREGDDEIKTALAGRNFTDLIAADDIQGMVHCHSTYSDGRNSIEEMALAAQAMGMSYITITDHSPAAHYANGVSVERLKEQWAEIDAVQERVTIKILRGTESDILDTGALDYPDHILEKFDVLIGSIHSRLKMDEDQMTRRLIYCMKLPQFKIWGHALGRLVLRRPPLSCRIEEVLDAAAQSNVAIEVNGDPYRLDMEPRLIKLARKRGIKFVISTDAHSTQDLQNLQYGVHLARRGGLTRSEVLNSYPLSDFKRAVIPTR